MSDGMRLGVAIGQIVAALVLAPLLLGVVHRTKALFAGRRGPPLLQLYWDLGKLLRKGAVYSETTTWVFRAGPMVGLAAVIVALAIVPTAVSPALLAFRGDLFLFAHLLGLMRLFLVLAALDTGSAFEGMGASREAIFSALAEPALVVGLAAIACLTGTWSLSTMMGSLGGGLWVQQAPALSMVAIALLAVYLTENSRVPVDDPGTHLELTMIHEVMVLDHGGPDLAFILYGASLKLWTLGALLVGLALPVHTGVVWQDALIFSGGMLVVAVVTGILESTMARLRLSRVPQLLIGAGALAFFALLLVVRA